MSDTIEPNFEDELRRLREHGPQAWDTTRKNKGLRDLAEALVAAGPTILAANARDLARLDQNATAAFRDRLTITRARLDAMAKSVLDVADLEDPVGEVVEARTLANGLNVRRVRAPLGVIFMIFESRPNVAIEAFSIAFKSGNAIILRGGKESSETSAELYRVMRSVFADPAPFCGVTNSDRALVTHLLRRPDLIDVVVPRGGDKLIRFVRDTALMPLIKNDRGMCHAFVDQTADLKVALNVVINAKTQRPGVCNAIETLLIHRAVAREFLVTLLGAAPEVEFRADDESRQWLGNDLRVKSARAEDWDTEHLDLILNCRVVGSLDEALAHIARHGSGHSEAIITASEANARLFQTRVDAAAVYWNASTRFTDGHALGLGGELGISTQKLHVRGPVGVRELTTPRWLIDGTGQIRG